MTTSPETRHVPQAAWAPRQSQDGSPPTDADAPLLPARVADKQAILAIGFSQPASSAVLVDQLARTKAPLVDLLGPAVFALHQGDRVTVAAALAQRSFEEVLGFASAGLTVEQDLLDRSAPVLAQLLDPNFDPNPNPNKVVAVAGAGRALAVRAFEADATIAAYLASQNVLVTVDADTVALTDTFIGSWAVARATLLSRLATKRNALMAAARSSARDPLGYLHLQRLDMTPVGYRRGDLVYAMTLLPGETVRMTHTEWSRTDSEFTSLVATSAESATQDSLTEKSELTESTTAQESHTMALSASLSGGGGIGVVHAEANAGFNYNTQQSTTSQNTAKSTRELTRQASSRAKQEHKVTFRVSVSSGTTDESFRKFKNITADPARFDFHRMMRTWDCKLYEYSGRLTYDLTIPEPGSYLLRLYKEIDDLTTFINAAAPPLPSLSAVRPGSELRLSGQYNVVVESAPAPQAVHAVVTVSFSGDWTQDGSATVDVPVPDGYALSSHATASWVNARKDDAGADTSEVDPREAENQARLVGDNTTGSFPWMFGYRWFNGPKQGSRLTVTVDGVATPTEATLSQWRAKAYGQICDAVTSVYQAKLSAAALRRDELRSQVEALDSLSLRRREKEELVKGALRWLLGPTFSFYPNDLPGRLLDSQAGSSSDLDTGPDESMPGLYSPDTGAVTDGRTWQAELQHGDLISFIHEAVEWENIAFLLYPYIWADHDRWDFKQRLTHADDAHEQFLRAGAARVVLTIRPGFEGAFLQYADTLQLGDPPSRAGTPYQRIADEMKTVDATFSEQDSSLASPEESYVLIDEWTEWTPTGALDVIRGETLEV